MANIIVSNVCNLDCDYCFSKNVIRDTTKFISIKELSKILNWLYSSGSKISSLGLIGGEPLLHPEFFKILNMCLTYPNTALKTPVILYTNGLNIISVFNNDPTYLLEERVQMLINCTPNTGLKENLDFLNEINPHSIGNSYSIGCNLYPQLKDYQYFWNIVDNYDAKAVRCSVATPCNVVNYYNGDDKFKYFSEMKNVYLDFCKCAIERGCKVVMDCSYIPICEFTDDELKIVSSAVADINFFTKKCLNQPIDIMPDGTAFPCFGTYKYKTNIFEFKGYGELYQYFYSLLLNKLYNNHNNQSCKSCIKYTTGNCQGGCLGLM